MKQAKYTDRDLSWLSFNERIIQEVERKELPLMERLKFAAIYSSNLEEFYKVRVASHRFSQKYRGDKKNKFGYRPSFLLPEINSIVSEQQARLGHVFRNEIVAEMANEGIFLLNENLNSIDKKLVSEYFDKHLKGNFSLKEITDDERLELKNQAIYLYIIHKAKSYLLELDYKKFGRFIKIFESESENRIIQLDDIFKNNLPKFIDEQAQVFAVKVSRDAELYIDEEQDNSIVKKIQKSLKKRDTGMPCRLLFDENIPFKHINQLKKKIGIDMASLVPGGKYHNFYDFFGFPEFSNKPHLYSKENDKVPCSYLDKASDWFEAIKNKDVFLSFPYQKFNYVSEFLNKAANDSNVEEINITLYRVGSKSEICQALEAAANNGKKVFVLDEVQARFDEESNIDWGARLEKAGATVKYQIKKLKVHAKIFSITRKEGNTKVIYSYLGTGNLNEKTAKIYADHGILTADEKYTKDLEEVFKFLKDEKHVPNFKTLLVAPFTLRSTIYNLIENEIETAKKGNEARIMVKVNSLEDPRMINKIRQAADSGVKIDMVVRGICCFYPLNEKQKKNIKVVSIIDQYLEHTRIFYFYNNGDPKTYLASADWMTRNLSKRIEVSFPVFDEKALNIIQKQFDFQLNDRLNGRLTASEVENSFVSGSNEKSAQQMMFDIIES